jgi:hypothetical protein
MPKRRRFKKAISPRDRPASVKAARDLARFGMFTRLDAHLHTQLLELVELRERLREAELSADLQSAERAHGPASNKACPGIVSRDGLSVWRDTNGRRGQVQPSNSGLHAPYGLEPLPGRPWPRARTGAALLPPHTIGIIPASTKAGDASRRGGNGEQQIEVACRGADTHQEARAASAPHSSAAWIASVLRKVERGTEAPRSSVIFQAASGVSSASLPSG